MHLPHLLDLVEVDDEASLIRVVFLDALAAEDSPVVTTVEVLHALVMLLAEEAVDTLLVLEVDVAQDGVPLYDLVQDVEVERQLVDRLDLLDELPANGASHAEIMVQILEAVGAEGVPTVDEDARDLLSDGELVAAEVTKVQPSRQVVSLDDGGHGLLTGLLFIEVAIFLVFGTLFVYCLHFLLGWLIQGTYLGRRLLGVAISTKAILPLSSLRSNRFRLGVCWLFGKLIVSWFGIHF